MLPTQIWHTDWGTAPDKRWLARATLRADGRYAAGAPCPVGDHAGLIPSIRAEIGSDSSCLVGFDFPIGIPAAYARLAGVTEFKPFLRELGRAMWADFYNVAQLPSQISLHRPFYPAKPGRAKQAHLLSAFGLKNIDELRRECEKKQPSRRAACPLFWTLGASQVGKGAIVGWRDVLAPALRDGKDVLLWPFDGRLNHLLRPAKIVAVETYPSECYGWFFPETLKGKAKQEVRRKAAGPLLKWAQSVALELEAALERKIEEGFPEGDDAFDAVVGLLGMLAVVVGHRPPGDTIDERITRIEGWILGQSPSSLG